MSLTAFPTVESRREFKVRYRDALDALPVDDATAQAIVDEANLAFQNEPQCVP